MKISVRGFNFIEDFGRATIGVPQINDDLILSIISTFARNERAYGDAYDNLNEEKKRFISWLYASISEERYDELLVKDSTGFLISCTELYDPKTETLKPPAYATDYSVDYK